MYGKPEAGQSNFRGELPSNKEPGNLNEESFYSSTKFLQNKNNLPDKTFIPKEYNLPDLPKLPYPDLQKDIKILTKKTQQLTLLKRPQEVFDELISKEKPKSLHERLQNYYEVRDRIFNTTTSKRILKLRKRFGKKRKYFKAISATCISGSDTPIRKYIHFR